MLLQWVLEVDGLAVGHIRYAGDPQPGVGLGNSADIGGNGVYRLGHTARRRKKVQRATDSHRRFEKIYSRGS